MFRDRNISLQGVIQGRLVAYFNNRSPEVSAESTDRRGHLFSGNHGFFGYASFDLPAEDHLRFVLHPTSSPLSCSSHILVLNLLRFVHRHNSTAEPNNTQYPYDRRKQSQAKSQFVRKKPDSSAHHVRVHAAISGDKEGDEVQNIFPQHGLRRI